MAFEAGTIIARLGLDTKSFDRNIGRLDRVGKKLSRNISLPIAAAGLVVTKLAADFESSFAGVRKTVDATEAEFEKLSKGFRDMAKEIPVNVNELNRVGEAAGQLGIRTENILDFTRTMADLGVATNLSAEQAATSLARLANITGLPQDQFDRLGSTIVALGNNFATTEAEIVEMGLRIAGAGEQIGLAEGQILAISTALSSVGISAEAGGTAISKVMINMASAVSSGGESLQQFASVAGMSGQDFARVFRDDAAAAINSFVVGLGDMQDSGGDVLGTLAAMGIEEVRMRDALLRAASAGDLLSEALDLQGNAWTENTALAEEARKRYETFSSQLTIFWNRLKDIGITLGTSLLPVFRDALDAAQPLVDVIEKAANAFAWLPKPIRLVTVGLVGLAAAVGPVLIGFKGLTATLLVNAAAAKANAAAHAAGSAAFIVSQSRLGNFVHLLPKFSTKTIQGRDAMGRFTQGVRVFNKEFITAPGKIARFSGVLASAGKSAAAGFAGYAAVAAGTIAAGFKLGNVLSDLAVAYRSEADAIDQAIQKQGLFKAGLSLIPDILARAGQGLKSAASSALDFAKSLSKSMTDTAKSLVPDTLIKFGQTAKSVFSDVFIGGSIDFLQGKLQKLSDALFGVKRNAEGLVDTSLIPLSAQDLQLLDEASEKLGRMFAQTPAGVKKAVSAMNEYNKSLRESGLAEQAKNLRQSVTALLDAKDKTDLLSRASSLAGVEITEQAKALEVLRQAAAKAAEEQRKAASDQMLQSFEALTFEGMAQQAQLVDKALGRLKGTLPIEEMRRLRDEWEPWLSRLGVTAPALEKVIAEANRMRDALAQIKVPELDWSEVTEGLEELFPVSEKLPKHLLTLGAGLSNTERAALGMPPVLDSMSEKTEAFGRSLQGTSVLLNSFESNVGKAFGGAASAVQGSNKLFSGGLGGFKQLFQKKTDTGAFVTSFSTIFSGLPKALPAIGQMVGPAIELLGMLFKPKWKKLGEQGARLFGKEFSEKLSKELLKSQKALGSFQNAVAANIGDIAQEVGVNTKNLGQTLRSLDILIGMVENRTLRWADAAEQMDKAFGPIKDRLIEMGTEGVFQLGRLIERMRELGKVSADVQAFIQEKAKSAVEAMMAYFENLAKQEDLTAQRAQELVGVVATAFQAAIAAGGGLLGAVQQLGPAFGEVIQKLRGVLGDDNPLLNQVTRFYNFVSNNQEQLAAISSLGTAFKELAAIGLINAANIGDFAGTFQAEFDKILASTEDQTAAMAAMGPQIGLLLESYRELGMQVPPWLEEMAGKAKEAGANLTPPEGTIDIFRDIRDMLGELVDAFKGVSAEARRASAAMGGMGGPGGFPDGLGNGGNDHMYGARGLDVLVGGPLGPVDFTAGEAGMERVFIEPLDGDDGSRRGALADDGLGGGGSRTINVTNQFVLDGAVIGTTKELAEAFAPVVTRALRDDPNVQREVKRITE